MLTDHETQATGTAPNSDGALRQGGTDPDPAHGSNAIVTDAGRPQRDEAWSVHRRPAAAQCLQPRQQRVFTAEELQGAAFPPLKFILPGLIPVGVTLLVSRPKLGKSWLVLDLAIAVATGRPTLGNLMAPSPGDVLYLALEDGSRRLQSRMTRLLPATCGAWPSRLTIATEWLRADRGGLYEAGRWLTSVADPRLIVVDTLARFRHASHAKATYANDYAALSGLQSFAIKHDIGIVIVHHDRKSGAGDVFDTVAGTLGLTGAVDTILMLKRRGGRVTLHTRGRDVEEAELAVEFDRATCQWRILGPAAEVRRSEERARVLAALGGAVRELGVSEIMAAAALPSRNAADQLLFKMARDGEIVRIARGTYGLPAHAGGEAGKIDKTERSITQNVDDAAGIGAPPILSLSQ